MLRYLLKKIGRLFVILTHEDARIDSKKIKKALIVNLPSEEHLGKAFTAISKRFEGAEFTAVIPGYKSGIASRIIPPENILLLSHETLRKIKKDNFDAVIVLSLNPCLVWQVFRMFSCPKLLYNYCGEWYLVRRRGLREFLTGEEGVDRTTGRTHGVKISGVFYRPIWNIIKIPFGLLYTMARFLKLIFYLVFGSLYLLIRKLFFV